MFPQLHGNCHTNPKDVMPPCNFKTFTILVRRLQKGLRYDFTDKYFMTIVVSTPILLSEFAFLGFEPIPIVHKSNLI